MTWNSIQDDEEQQNQAFGERVDILQGCGSTTLHKPTSYIL